MDNKHSIPSAFFIIFFLYSITGCVYYIKPVDESICTKCVNFIEDGKTKKEEVLQKSDFYALTKTFMSKNDTIFIFELSSGVGKDIGFYDLVLIFDQNDLLKKHSLVKKW